MAVLDWLQQLLGGDPGGSGQLSGPAQSPMQQNPQTGAFEPYTPPQSPSAIDMLANLTGATDMQQAYGAAQRGEYLPALGQGAYGAGQAATMAVPALRSGMAAVRAGAPVAREMAGALPALMRDEFGGIKVYHGSPYDFNAFDASKIGTGEGAQAYGHGLYFAENPAVTEQYRKMNLGVDGAGNLIYPPGIDRSKIYYPTAEPQAKVDALYRRLDELNSAPKTAEWDATVAKIHEAQQELEAARSKPTGRMYEVDLNAEPHQFLDWDKPLSEQSQQVRDVIAGRTDWTSPNMTGGQLYESSRLVPGAFRDPRAASQRLNEEFGIPGIRYLDQGSRVAGQGTSNYVMFDPALITILRKYGLMGPAVGAGLLGAEQQ